MPGVNLDFLPASEAADALGSPDSACAESGLEEKIGDLLIQDEAGDEEEPLCKRKFELMLQCAVSEIHSDLQAFGKQVDSRLLEAATQVAPLAEAFAQLQEQNTRLRIQQEILVRQVETLCQVMGLTNPSFSSLAGEESSPTQCETIIVSNDFPNLPTDISPCTSPSAALEESHGNSSCSLQDSPATSPQDPPAFTLVEIPSSSHQDSISRSQDSDSVSAETNTQTLEILAPSPVPHLPTFASLRALSAPSLMTSSSCKDSTVLFSATWRIVLPAESRIQFASSSSDISWL